MSDGDKFLGINRNEKRRSNGESVRVSESVSVIQFISIQS